ncbi:hypothetical protein FRC06_004470 [Ceratobasidium sp. 370]|nr:hypothetical protein FRC06_004470 [Ceratobasidium sp. 370]
MSNEILFNSHALSSLKRAQLIKLCKRYGIKATGKSSELVTKLEEYAQTLPPASTFICPSEADILSSPLKQSFSDYSGSDVEADVPARSGSERGRPSDQWEGISGAEGVFASGGPVKVEQGILAPRTNGTVESSRSGKSAEEFGGESQSSGKVGSSSSKSSISSSLKSIASAFVRPNKPAPEPRPPTPPPSAIRREITPPPVQGPGPNTVRLIPSPSPFPRPRSAADLLPGVPLPSPSFDKLAADLAKADAVLANVGSEASPSGPRISFGFGAAGYDDEDVSMAAVTQPTDRGASNVGAISDKENALPGISPSAPVQPQSATTGPDPVAPPSETFVFGSPRYSVSNTQFGDAAAAVLREMNARMGVSTSTQAVSLEQLANVMANKTSVPASARVEKKGDLRFRDQHEKEFAKMASIANHYSVTSRVNKRKSQHEPSSSNDSNPNKIFTLPPHIVAPPTLPERSAKRARMSTVDGEELAQPSAPSASVVEDKVLRDSAVVRANLERKRRSSAARASLAGRKSPGGPRKSAPRQPPPPSSSRFGFVGRIVSRVWSGGSKKWKEKEEEKKKDEKGKAKAKPAPPAPAAAERKPSVSATKKFPSVPTEEPAHVPNFPSAPKAKLAGSAGIGLGRPSSVVPKANHARPSTTAKGSATSKAAGGSKPGAIPTTSKPVATTKIVARPLPVPPTGVGRAATSGKAIAPSARMASPPARASSVASGAGRGALSPPAGARPPTTATRKSVVSPLAVSRKSTITQGIRSPAATGAGAGRQSIFKTPLTIDAMTMRGSAPTIQPFRLSPQANIPAASVPLAPTAAATSPKPPLKPPTATRSTNTTVSRTQRRPRISRSKVIARLEEKRAAAATASKPAALSPVSKARSSAHIRRSLGAVAARKVLDADMDRRARMRKSEAARRKSKVAPALGRRSEGAVLKANRHDDVEMNG